MDLCKFCGSPYEKEIKEGTIHHFEVCKSESIILMIQLRKLLEIKSHDDIRCNVCLQQISSRMFGKHLEEKHPQAIALIQKLTNNHKNVPDNTIVTCHLCDSNFPACYRAEHCSRFHSESMSIVWQVSNSIKSSHETNIPVVRVCSFCGIEYLKENAYNHMLKCKGESVVLVKQLRDRFKITSQDQLKSSAMDRCRVCSAQFPMTKFIDHIAEFHPSCMDLVLKLTKRNTSNKYAKRCNLCGFLFITNKLPEHYLQFHPESMSMASQIANKFNSSDLKRNFDSAGPSKKTIVKSKVSKAMGMIAKKESIQGKKQILRKGGMKVSRTDIAFAKHKELLPIGKQERNTRLNSKARVKKLAEGVSGNKKEKLQERDQLLCVCLERLPDNLYQECMNNGFIVLQENNCDKLMANFPANTQKRLNNDVIENLPETKSVNISLEETCSHIFVPNKIPTDITSVNIDSTHKPVKNEIAPEIEVNMKRLNPYVKLERLSFHLCQGNGVDQEEGDISIQTLVDDVNHTVAISKEFLENFAVNISIDTKVGTSLKIVDLKMYKKWAEVANNVPLENLLKKMIKKTQEKETKKEVLYCQKQLKQFALKHPEIPLDLKDKLINARKYLTDAKSSKTFLKEFLLIKKGTTRINVQFLLNKLLLAMKRVPI